MAVAILCDPPETSITWESITDLFFCVETVRSAVADCVVEASPELLDCPWNKLEKSNKTIFFI